jgi:membrane-associated phospholipid phosphatase
MYRLLLSYDVTVNSLPSLHASLVTFAVGLGFRTCLLDAPRLLRMACVAWTGLILYATLATKEHYFVDIVSGVALGLFGHAWAWRRFNTARATSLPPRLKAA